MISFNSKCKTKYTTLTKEYIKMSEQSSKSKEQIITISFKVNNKKINNFKNKIISSKNRNYNNLINID